MAKEKLTIAVSGLNNIDSPGPGVSVIRGLRQATSFDVRIIGFAYENLEPAIYIDQLIDATYHIPYPQAGTDVLLDKIKEIHAKEHLNMIIPNFDAELYSFMKLEEALDQIGIKMFLPDREKFEERHKVNLPKFGEKYNIKVPASKAITEAYELYELGDEFDFPYLIKGKWYDAYIAYTSEQAVNYFNKVSAKWGLPVVVQQFVHGTEYNVTGLGDGKGNTMAAVPMRKLYITDKGKAWAGISLDEPKLLELTDHFISQTKWKGGFELELMKTQEDEYHLLEINPRIPAWVYLAIGAGQNIPETLVNLAMGKEVKPYEDYKVGRIFIRYSWDMVIDREQFEQFSIKGVL
ncbi:MAG: ATP-grasp domain-containing protein [Bacteroidales bacterium]|nr:ATP-grasp domain-containing protein [Bacteroidales bacterium]